MLLSSFQIYILLWLLLESYCGPIVVGAVVYIAKTERFGFGLYHRKVVEVEATHDDVWVGGHGADVGFEVGKQDVAVDVG